MAASTAVSWQVEGGQWHSIQMQPVGDDEYTVVIPAQEVGTKIHYYIHAADASGRSANRLKKLSNYTNPE